MNCTSSSPASGPLAVVSSKTRYVNQLDKKSVSCLLLFGRHGGHTTCRKLYSLVFENLEIQEIQDLTRGELCLLNKDDET